MDEETQHVPLAAQKCLPCEGGIPALSADAVARLAEQLSVEWQVVNGRRLEAEYRFPDFAGALGFTNQVGELAEAEGHHPEVLLGWGKAKIFLWTHAADGLTNNDFILASKISKLVDR
jgi:4a-hydroxytetrahydrobiopterin dehydratase